MAVKFSFDERKWLLKCHWKVENVVEVQRLWRAEFGTLPPTRVTITRIRVTFEVDGMVKDVLEGRCYQVPASISRFNPSRLLPLSNFKENSLRHKTTNTGETERSD